MRFLTGSMEISSDTGTPEVGTGGEKVLLARSRIWIPLELGVPESPTVSTALFVAAFTATPHVWQLPPEKLAVPVLPLFSVLVRVEPESK